MIFIYSINILLSTYYTIGTMVDTRYRANNRQLHCYAENQNIVMQERLCSYLEFSDQRRPLQKTVTTQISINNKQPYVSPTMIQKYNRILGRH